MTDTTEDQEPKPLSKKITVGFIGLLSLAWIVFPEPTDAVPVLGWLDEAAAAGILIACLNYLGINVNKWKTLFEKGEMAQTQNQEPKEKSVKGKVVEN